MKPSIYQVFPRIALTDRQWPAKSLINAPTWCSIDLRDGSQALSSPMTIAQKHSLFDLLVAIGIKQIEIGTPGRTAADATFIRQLIDNHSIPDDVTIQVMSQMKDADIEATFDAIKGLKKVIVHLYNTTSVLRRDAIYEMAAEEIIAKARKGFQQAVTLAATMPNATVQFEYSPEGFNTTEPRLVVDICKAVLEVTDASVQCPLIINLQSTVETDLPNVYADQIEWLTRQLPQDGRIIWSIQPHNDRGCAIAAAEMGQLAGATRVEGSLLGNGERAGSACLVTLGLNLYTQGIEPHLELSDVEHIKSVVEACTNIQTAARHPYVGSLAFAAFAAPHQFAINEAFVAYANSDKSEWLVPYLSMDPTDIGRGYDDIIRVSALSGRTGIAHVMEKYHGYQLPKPMQSEFSDVIKRRALELGTEITAQQVWEYFADEYFKGQSPLALLSINFEQDTQIPSLLHCVGEISYLETVHRLSCQGNGVLDAVITGLHATFDVKVDIVDHVQHALGQGQAAKAVSYVQIVDSHQATCWGVGVDSDTTLATLRALLCAINRKMEKSDA